jgi:hypothetical protein
VSSIADVKGRDSALDLMETVRPDVDRDILDLMRSRPFAKGDFAESRRGDVRVGPPLSRELSETTRTWAALIAPIAEYTQGSSPKVLARHSRRCRRR